MTLEEAGEVVEGTLAIPAAGTTQLCGLGALYALGVMARTVRYAPLPLLRTLVRCARAEALSPNRRSHITKLMLGARHQMG